MQAGSPADLEASLGHRFARPALLDEALTHRSAPQPAGTNHRSRIGVVNYERLEFLGDRVLGLVIAEMLLDRFADETEGKLARRYTGLVRQETLAAVAAELDLGRLVRLPVIEEPFARSNPALLADVCEAVIAALYIDGGLDAARGFIRRFWTARMEAEKAPPKDPKTELQEWAQARALALPSYRLVATEGPPHQPAFTVAAGIDGWPEATATAGSKRLAETAAAAALLASIAATGAP